MTRRDVTSCITAYDVLAVAGARRRAPTRAPFRVGLVQERWHADPDEHRDAARERRRASPPPRARGSCASRS